MPVTKVTKNEITRDPNFDIRDSSTMNTISSLSSTFQTAYTWTCPEGIENATVQIIGNFEFNSSANAAEMTGRIMKNGTTLLGQNYYNSTGVTYFNTISVVGQTTISAGETIVFQAARTTGTGNTLSNRSRFIISS